MTYAIEERAIYGKCLVMTDGAVKLAVTVDVGPRVVEYSVNGKNIMFNDVNDKFNQNNNPTFEVFGADKGYWHIYGGHRIWTSPEAMPRSYYPDNAPVAYEVDGDTVTFTPPSQVWTGTDFKLTITLKDGKAHVVNSITNTSAWDSTFAVWALTVMKVGGLEVVPYPFGDPNALLANRTLAIWPYSNMSDERVNWGTKYIRINATEKDQAFKLGLNNERGFALYFIDGALFVKQHKHCNCVTYPDGGCSFETYTNGSFIEMETLGALQSVAAGQTVSHEEWWAIYDDITVPADECAIDATVEKYVC